MRKKMRDVVLLVLMYLSLAFGLSGLISLGILNFQNPDFTELRMLIEFWPINLLTGLSFILCKVCADLLKY